MTDGAGLDSPLAPISAWLPGFLRGLNKKSLRESCASKRLKASSGSQGFGPNQLSSLSHTRLQSRPHTFFRISDPKRRAFGQRLGRPEGAVGLRSLLVESGWGPARGLGRSRHPLRGGGGGGGGGGGREGGHGGVQVEVGRAAERPEGEPGRRPPPPPCRKSSPAWTTSSSTWRSPWSSSSGRSRCPFLAWTVSTGPGGWATPILTRSSPCPESREPHLRSAPPLPSWDVPLSVELRNPFLGSLIPRGQPSGQQDRVGSSSERVLS